MLDQVQQETAEPAVEQETGVDSTQAEGETGAADQQVETQAKEKDPAKAFAARLGHERKKITAELGKYKDVVEQQAKAAGMGAEEYLEYVKQQMEKEDIEAEAEEQGKSPEEVKLAREKADLEQKLAKYERQTKMTEEEKTLTEDPKIGGFVKENLERLREIADAAQVDLQVALAMVAAEKLPEILELTKPDQHIQKYLEGLKNGGKPVEIGGGATTPQATVPKSFDDAKASAIERLKSAMKS